MAMESLNGSAEQNDKDDPLTSSAVRPRSAFLPMPRFGMFGMLEDDEEEEITATRLLFADQLRPPKIFEVASLLPEDEEDTEEDIVTSVVRRPSASAQTAQNDEASVDDDPEIVDVIALADVIAPNQPPPLPSLPLRLPRILPPPVQDRTVFLGTPRRKRPAPSHINMDEEARAALKARLEEVAAAVRRREIDFGATDAEAEEEKAKAMTAPLSMVPPVAPPFADGGWPLLPWTDSPSVTPHVHVQQQRNLQPLTSRKKEQQANSIAMAGVAVLLIAGIIMGLSTLRPKTYGSTCNFLCLR